MNVVRMCVPGYQPRVRSDGHQTLVVVLRHREYQFQVFPSGQPVTIGRGGLSGSLTAHGLVATFPRTRSKGGSIDLQAIWQCASTYAGLPG